MKVNLNNSELVAIFKAIDTFLDYSVDKMEMTALLSFAKKINDNSRTVNCIPEGLAIDTINMLEEILEEE